MDDLTVAIEAAIAAVDELMESSPIHGPLDSQTERAQTEPHQAEPHQTGPRQTEPHQTERNQTEPLDGAHGLDDDDLLRAQELLHRLASRATEAASVIAGKHRWGGSPGWAGGILSDDEAFNTAPAPLLLTDGLGYIVKANDRVLALAERTMDELTGLHVGEFIHADDYENVADIWVRMQVETTFDSAITEFRLALPRGPAWYRAAIRAVREPDMTLASLSIHLTDVGDKHTDSAEADRNARKFGNLLDSLPDPITRLGSDLQVQFANPAAREFRARFSDHDWPVVIGDDLERYIGAFNDAWNDGRPRSVEHGLSAGSSIHWAETTFVPEVGPSGRTESVLVIWRDQTHRRQHEEFLAHQAMHDSLTGLPNRARFAELLEIAIERQRTAAELGQDRSLAVLFLDLDRFKFVNDSLGHLAGDELLQRVSRRLSGAVRPGDVIGRLGGDEFTILAEDISTHDAKVMAERIQDRMKEPFRLADREFIISVSIGIVSSESPQEATDLMRWADSAMYRSKSLGRDRVTTFEQVFAPEVVDQLDMDQMVRSAVDKNELELHFQPEVLLSSRRIVGAEALVRWNHPSKGLLGADKFIPIAEDNGTIHSLGTWVLHSACEQAVAWLANGVVGDDFVLRVNLSPRQLEGDRLVDTVASVLETTGLPPSMLCLEITETGLMGDMELALEVLRNLSTLGITLAVDDFGTGYSSLGALKRFPINVLKIDMSFVSGITTEAHDAAIVRTILALADTLGLLTTAEGVETIEQCAALEAMGCTRGQGYLFSEPLPPADFGRLLSAPSSAHPRLTPAS